MTGADYGGIISGEKLDLGMTGPGDLVRHAGRIITAVGASVSGRPGFEIPLLDDRQAVGSAANTSVNICERNCRAVDSAARSSWSWPPRQP